MGDELGIPVSEDIRWDSMELKTCLMRSWAVCRVLGSLQMEIRGQDLENLPTMVRIVAIP